MTFKCCICTSLCQMDANLNEGEPYNVQSPLSKKLTRQKLARNFPNLKSGKLVPKVRQDYCNGVSEGPSLRRQHIIFSEYWITKLLNSFFFWQFLDLFISRRRSGSQVPETPIGGGYGAEERPPKIYYKQALESGTQMALTEEIIGFWILVPQYR